MASVFDLANLSALAYDSSKITFSDWTRIGYHGAISGEGFFAEIYMQAKQKDIVLSIRGTDGDAFDKSDILSDLQLAIGRAPAQLEHAFVAYEKTRKLAEQHFGYNYNLYLTGHSLGGGLASLLSAKKAGLPTVTFNAPGMQRSFIGSHLIDMIGQYNLGYVKTAKMLHIRAMGDPVSAGTGKHMGEVKEIYVDKWGDGKLLGASRHLAQHSITNMVEALNKLSWYKKNLGWTS